MSSLYRMELPISWLCPKSQAVFPFVSSLQKLNGQIKCSHWHMGNSLQSSLVLGKVTGCPSPFSLVSVWLWHQESKLQHSWHSSTPSFSSNTVCEALRVCGVWQNGSLFAICLKASRAFCRGWWVTVTALWLELECCYCPVTAVPCDTTNNLFGTGLL